MALQRNSDFQDFHENLWPSGWYLYEGGQFVGPLSADEAFRERGHTPDGKPRLVSRKGFAQWYPVHDLASIYMATADAKEKSKQRLQQAERELSSQIQTRSEIRESSPDTSTRVQHKTLAPQAAKKKIGSTATSVVPPHARTKPVPLANEATANVVRPKPASTQAQPTQAEPTQAEPTQATKAQVTASPGSNKAKAKSTETSQTMEPLQAKATPQTKAQAVAGKAALMQEYFILKGRMRLGRLHNPWVAGFFNTIASLGIYWYLWFASAFKEVTWHCQNRDRIAIPPTVLCLIPGVHFFMIYRLAKAVVEMEQQNKYQTVSPVLATVYGVFPPFAVTYLQDAINRHWMLHVRHSLARKA